MTLAFGANVMSIGARVRVTGPAGALVSSGAPSVAGNTVRQPLARGLPPGTYTVDWRVPAANGQPAAGSFTFAAGSGSSLAAASLARDRQDGDRAGWLTVAGIAAGGALAVARLGSLRRRRPATARPGDVRSLC